MCHGIHFGKKEVFSQKIEIQRKNVRKTNEALWDAAEAGNVQKVQDLIDKKMQAYPAEINSKYRLISDMIEKQ